MSENHPTTNPMTDKQIEAMRPPPLWLCVLRPAVVPMITMIGTTFLLLWMEGKL